jgi:hypothetical protein
MPQSNDERDRPTEWLRRLAEDRAHYAELLRTSGSFAVAAYRLASARLRVQPTGASRVPTAAELRVAAAEICRRTGFAVTYRLNSSPTASTPGARDLSPGARGLLHHTDER